MNGKREEWLLQFDKISQRTCLKSKNELSLYYSKSLNLFALVNDSMSTKRFYVKEMWR